MKLAAYFLLCGSLLSAVPAYASSDMQKELEELREDLQVLQRQIYRGAGSSGESAKSDTVSKEQASAGNIQVKIGEYDEVIRKVNGRMDTLEYQLKQLDGKLDKINRDFEIRFKILEGRSVPANLSAPTPTVPTVYDAPVASGASKAVTGDGIHGDDLAPIAGSNVAAEKTSAAASDNGMPQSLIADDVSANPAPVSKAKSAEEIYANG